MAIILSLYFGSNEYINGSISFKDISKLNLYVVESPNEELNNHADDYEFEFHANQKRIIFNESYLGGISLSVISFNYADIYNDFLKNGRNITDENECIIGENLSNKYKIYLNDMITIGNKEFIVSGITKLPRFSQKILVCDETVVEIIYPKFYFFNDQLSQDNLERSHIYSHEKIYDYFTNFLDNTSIISIIFACLIVLFYSLMSITNIHKFYNERLQITNFIQFAIGAAKKIIFLQCLIENILISFTASFLAYISARCILNLLMQLTSFYLFLPLRSVFIILLFALLLSAILAFINVKLNSRVVKEVR